MGIAYPWVFCTLLPQYMERIDAILLGTVGAIGAALWLISRDDDPLDEIGDAIMTLTTSEESRFANLEPSTQTAARALLADLDSQGIKAYVGSTLRTPAQEKATSTAQTYSWHEIGRAIDMYPRDPNTGSVIYNGSRVDLSLAISRTAEKHGFRQLGFNDDDSKRLITNKRGKKIWDSGHIEYRAPYATLAEAITAEGSSYGIG